jgi:hypothetical protein
MGKAELKDKLHEEIEHSDERLLKMIYALVTEYHAGDEPSDARKKLVMAERERYLQGEGESYTWQQVKEMATNRKTPDGL